MRLYLAGYFDWKKNCIFQKSWVLLVKHCNVYIRSSSKKWYLLNMYVCDYIYIYLSMMASPSVHYER